MSIVVRLLLDGNPKGYDVADHISTRVEVNPRMLSALKNAKYVLSMNPGGGGGLLDISGWISGGFSCLGYETDRSVLFQFR